MAEATWFCSRHASDDKVSRRDGTHKEGELSEYECKNLNRLMDLSSDQHILCEIADATENITKQNDV